MLEIQPGAIEIACDQYTGPAFGIASDVGTTATDVQLPFRGTGPDAQSRNALPKREHPVPIVEQAS